MRWEFWGAGNVIVDGREEAIRNDALTGCVLNG